MSTTTKCKTTYFVRVNDVYYVDYLLPSSEKGQVRMSFQEASNNRLAVGKTFELPTEVALSHRIKN